MTYSSEERGIFPYKDGTVGPDGQLRVVRGDPLALHRRLLEAAGGEQELADLWQRAHAVGPDGRSLAPGALAEQETLARVACQAFGIMPLAPVGDEGLTEAEVLDELYRFNAFLQKKATSTASSPSSSPPTPGSPPATAGSATTPTSGSG